MLVTLVGKNKFAGITCIGTKDNMVCEKGEPLTYTYITYNANGGTIENESTRRIWRR